MSAGDGRGGAGLEYADTAAQAVDADEQVAADAENGGRGGRGGRGEAAAPVAGRRGGRPGVRPLLRGVAVFPHQPDPVSVSAPAQLRRALWWGREEGKAAEAARAVCPGPAEAPKR